MSCIEFLLVFSHIMNEIKIITHAILCAMHSGMFYVLGLCKIDYVKYIWDFSNPRDQSENQQKLYSRCHLLDPLQLRGTFLLTKGSFSARMPLFVPYFFSLSGLHRVVRIMKFSMQHAKFYPQHTA